MRIPKQFTLHGHTINVREVEKMEFNSYGEYNNAREKITIAHQVKDDEAEAQSYAGLMIELLKSSGIEINPNLIHEPVKHTYDD